MSNDIQQSFDASPKAHLYTFSIRLGENRYTIKVTAQTEQQACQFRDNIISLCEEVGLSVYNALTKKGLTIPDCTPHLARQNPNYMLDIRSQIFDPLLYASLKYDNLQANSDRFTLKISPAISNDEHSIEIFLPWSQAKEIKFSTNDCLYPEQCKNFIQDMVNQIKQFDKATYVKDVKQQFLHLFSVVIQLAHNFDAKPLNVSSNIVFDNLAEKYGKYQFLLRPRELEYMDGFCHFLNGVHSNFKSGNSQFNSKNIEHTDLLNPNQAYGEIQYTKLMYLASNPLIKVLGPKESSKLAETYIKLLVHTGADINQCDSLGRTALMYFAAKGEFFENITVHSNDDSFITTLLKLGADPKMKDQSGKTAYDYAKAKLGQKHPVTTALANPQQHLAAVNSAIGLNIGSTNRRRILKSMFVGLIIIEAAALTLINPMSLLTTKMLIASTLMTFCIGAGFVGFYNHFTNKQTNNIKDSGILGTNQNQNTNTVKSSSPSPPPLLCLVMGLIQRVLQQIKIAQHQLNPQPEKTNED